MRKPKYLPLGSVSSGTMRSEDLIPAFEGALREVRGGSAELVSLRRYTTSLSSDEEKANYVESLFDTLNDYAPPFCYFGAHEGDGAAYGCWPSYSVIAEAIRYGEAIEISDLSELPKGYTGDVFLVNDHGNMTHYRCVKGRTYEQWSLV
jgi:hypothetical protein